MPSEAIERPEPEQRLSAVLVACLEAMDNGQPVDRQELLARYPEFGAELVRFLDDEGQVDRFAAPLRAVARGGVPARLGDYRIVREVGRGGMGVVYEAEQVSLGRRVALKVLPFAATMDPRHLQRFHNEARAAASLDHPHIVHVHAVGCEQAVHFYAMQFIDGQTLAAMIADLRQRGGKAPLPEVQPTTPHAPGAPATDTAERAPSSTEPAPRDRTYFRRVAEWGIQAAEALDHAHQLGIVHRDIKPANLLVDGRGNLWVTDFGLAQVQSDVRLTQTGDLVGTLRYMSPEQALAKRVVVDHRTDVYSLGVTLYELLTLEPAFRGNDRQGLLRQIAFEEPRTPRRLNRAVPGELETIVLKAMEKNPAERYATAKEVADDLRRFLVDEPIRARRPGVVLRLRKWGRRHTAVVWSAAAVVFVALAVLSVSTVLILGALANEKDARGGEQRALGEANAALTAEKTARVLEQEATRREQEASYFLLMDVANRRWWENRVDLTRRALADCPRHLRRFEWHYLDRQCHSDLRTLSGHPGPVTGLAWSADGKRVAVLAEKKGAPENADSANPIMAIKVWEAATGRELLTVGPAFFNPLLALSPDGLRLAGTAEETRVWDVSTGKVALVLPGTGGGVTFSPDGLLLVTGGGKAGVTVWDARTGAKVAALAGSAGRVAFSPDGKRLVADMGRNGVKVWDWKTARQLHQLTQPGFVCAFAFGHDDRILALKEMSNGCLWDVASGKSLFSVAVSQLTLHAQAVAPDGERIAVGTPDEVVEVWDIKGGGTPRVVRGHTATVTAVAFSPDGRVLASGDEDGVVKLWDAAAEQAARVIRQDAVVHHLALSPTASTPFPLRPMWAAGS